MSGKLRVGVVGANWGMRAHLPAWHATGEAEVRAICTSRRETADAAAEQYGIAHRYWNVAAMCADPELDIIDVGTRPDLRAPMILEGLRQGKHVFASANFAPDLATARRLRAAARAAGTVCALDSVFMWQAPHRYIKRQLESGASGRPIAVNARLHISHFAAPGAGGASWKWFGKRKHGASALRNLGTHSLHLLTWLLGEVDAVAAQTTIAKEEWRFEDGTAMRPEVEDTAQLMLRFANGVLGILALGWASPARTGWQMELTTERQTFVTVDRQGFACGARLELFSGSGGEPLAPVQIPLDFAQLDGIDFAEEPPVPQAYDIAGALKHMIRAIRHGGMPLPSFDEAFHVEAVLDAARRAAEEGQWIDVERD